MAVDFRRALGLLEIAPKRRSHVIARTLYELFSKIRIRCDNHERGAIERVRPGGEDGERGIPALDHEFDFSALGAANPIALHSENFGWPAPLQRVKVIKQAVGIIGDFEIPLGQLLLDHHRTTAIRGAIG